jgi:CPA2 family monovalent cation:H+ antiporter-2
MAAGGRWLGRRMERPTHHLPPPGTAELQDHVVIGGFGRVGETIARLLAAENVPYVVLDTNAEVVALARRRGEPCYFGDAGRRELLDRVGAARARAFVVTVNARAAAERMVAAARRRRPDAMIFARAADAGHAARLMDRGALAVVPETVETSLQLGARLLEELGLSEEAVSQRLDILRADELARLERARAKGSA